MNKIYANVTQILHSNIITLHSLEQSAWHRIEKGVNPKLCRSYVMGSDNIVHLQLHVLALTNNFLRWYTYPRWISLVMVWIVHNEEY